VHCPADMPEGGKDLPRRRRAAAKWQAAAARHGRRHKWHGACLLHHVIHRASKFRRLTWSAGLMIALCEAFGAAASVVAATGELQDVGQLEDAVRAAALAQMPPLKDGQRLQVGPLQQKLQLPRCGDLRAERAPGIQVVGRALIEARCASPSAWHLYVPVKIIGTAPVVLAAHALVAGTVLTAKDMAVEQRDVSGLPPGYLEDPGIAIGLTAARAVAGGAILTNQQLLGTAGVQRGQSVTLMADAGGITVRMAGRALSDGLVNQRIRVENLSSGKIVEGITRSAQVVEIVF
jgi:flagella basal body P-ring formation protein FlgA